MSDQIEMPLVSVVVPSYNHSKYIGKCVRSIMEQTYSNFELIVIDDGSTDDSPYLLNELKSKYEIIFIAQDNMGLSNTLNRGFKHIARGKYLTSCASDDYWLPDKLKLQVEFLEKNQKCAMVYGKAIFIDENDVPILKRNNSVKNYKEGHIFDDILLQNFHPPVNYMFRKEAIHSVGYYTPNIWAEDFDMNLKIANKYQIGYIDEFISYYRVSFKGVNDLKTVKSHYDSIKRYNYHPFYALAIKKWHYRNFLYYSKYRRCKIISIRGMLRNIDMFYKKAYIKALLGLLLCWREG